MMKKCFFYIVLLFGYCISFAQQVPQYSNFLNNYFALNPALAGSNQCLNVKIGHRNQWVGFSGAPKTTFASFSSELKHKKIKTTFFFGWGSGRRRRTMYPPTIACGGSVFETVEPWSSLAWTPGEAITQLPASARPFLQKWHNGPGCVRNPCQK